MNIHKLFEVIPHRHQKQFPYVAMAMVLGAAFEAIGISLVLPLLEIISGSQNQVTEFISFHLGLDNQQNVVFFSLITFVFIYLLKGLYLSMLIWVCARFSHQVKAEVSNTLMEKYLHAAYEFHLLKNSAQLIRNLTNEANQLALNVLNPSLIIISEGLVVMAVGIFLLLAEPQVTIIVMSLLVVLSYFFQHLFGNFSKRIGQIRQHADGLIIQKSQESLGGIKDIKIFDREVTFLEEFRKHNLNSADASAKHYSISQLPRIYLETICVIFISIIIFFLALQGNDFQEIVPVLGVFVLAAFRLLQSANRILSSANALHFADSVVTNLYEEMKILPSKKVKTAKYDIQRSSIAFQKDIELKDVSYQYPKSKKFSLSNINLIFRKGESIGVIGKSGSGKSTLSDLILGLLKPTTGIINVDGISIYQNIKCWQSLIGCVQQDIFLLDDSIIRNITFGENYSKIDNEKIRSAIKDAKLEELIESLPNGLNTKLGERGLKISGGQKQRIGIARALYRNAPILIFDEATSALDNESESEIVSSIKNLQGKRTIIVIAHRLSTIEHCDRVVELKNGLIYKIDTKTQQTSDFRG